MNDEKKEIYDYIIEFDGEKAVDVNDLQAALIIRNVLWALDVDFDKINIERIIKYTFECQEGELTIDFPNGEPDYWYAEADINEKMLDVGIDDYSMRIPLFTILKWFSANKEDNR